MRKIYYPKIAESIKLPYGGLAKMAKNMNIGKWALSKILDGQRCSKWQWEYSFEEIRNLATSKFGGKFEV